jgi:hypothetical protein
MPTTSAERATIVPSPQPSAPRLALARVRAGRAVLDGGWWPRSRDPAAELPGLVLALSDHYGRIRQVMLSGRAWDSQLRRLAVGANVVRVGWFASLDPALLIATTDRGDQVDLLVVPPDTAVALAEQAMAAAADPANHRRATDLLAATAVPPAAAENDDSFDPSAVWDNEGGHIHASRRQHRPTDNQSSRSS